MCYSYFIMRKALLLVVSLAISILIILNKDSFVQLGQYGYLGIFLISILGNATVVIPAPAILTAVVGGSIFNPFAVGIIAALGATIGELTGYMSGVGGKVLVDKKPAYKKIEKWIKKHGFLTIFSLAVIPNPMFDLVGICAGMTNYPVIRFLIFTFLGKAIKFTMFALLGSSIL